MTTQLRGGHITEDPRLGRIPQFDEQSREYPVRALLQPEQQQLRGRSWIIPRVLNQGSTSACTGFSAGYDLLSTPSPIKHIDETTCQVIYREAQKQDEWAGENYEGSSVLGACKALAQMGFIGEYRWAFGIDDVLLSLAHVGPVVVGTDWQRSMFYPRRNGVLKVEGGLEETQGGHAYIIQSIIANPDYMKFVLGRGEPTRDCPLLRIHNSWGPGWGVNGDGLIWADDMERLLRGIAYPGEARITTAAFKKE